MTDEENKVEETSTEETVEETSTEETPETLGVNVSESVNTGDHFGASAESLKPENNQ